MQARADGLQRRGAVALGTLNDCPAVAADADHRRRASSPARRRTRIRAWPCARRAAAGAHRCGSPHDRYRDSRVAVSPRGDAVLAWVEYARPVVASRIRVARRRGRRGGWTVETLVRPRGSRFDDVDGRDDRRRRGAGLLNVDGRRSPGRGCVATRAAAPGATFDARAPDRDRPRFGAGPRSPSRRTGGRWSRSPASTTCPSTSARRAAPSAPPVSVFDGSVRGAPVIALRDDGAAVDRLAARAPDDPQFGVLRARRGRSGVGQRSELNIPAPALDPTGQLAVSPGDGARTRPRRAYRGRARRRTAARWSSTRPSEAAASASPP